MNTMENNNKGYTIVASNDYRKDEWIYDELQRHMTREEAQRALNDLAGQIFLEKDNFFYFNREAFDELVRERVEDGDNVEDYDWFEGEGWYECWGESGHLVYEQDKDSSFIDDTMHYSIAEDDYPDEEEEIEDEEDYDDYDE